MRNLAVLFLFFLTLSCQQAETPAVENQHLPGWPRHGVTYEIFIQSFADSNGDSIGDIQGVIDKLPYLTDLGIKAMWLMPVMESPSYHKYDVTDYRSIHSDYGTMEDFKTLVDQAHQRDIKIIIDLIINHTSDKHPWFIAAKNGNPQYRDYYVWADRDSIADQLAKKETSFDSDNITQWHAPDGDSTKDHYYGFFWGGMPDLNFDNPAVRDEMVDIARYWIEELGVDGFRLDAARHIYPDDQAEKSHAFWSEYYAKLKEIKPDIYLVGEVWENIEDQVPYAAGFSSLFNFDIAFSILESVNNQTQLSAFIHGHGWQVDSTTSFLDVYAESERAYARENKDFLIGTFLSNHDQNRTLSVLGNDPLKGKLAASILLTLPGHPYLYYGEELGMKGTKPDPNIREPFPWGDSYTTTWMEPEFTTATSVASVKQQQSDDYSILSHYKDLIQLRNEYHALSVGSMAVLEQNADELVAFERVYENEKLKIFHNLSDKEISVDAGSAGSVVFATFETPQVGSNMRLPARSTIIINMNN